MHAPLSNFDYLHMYVIAVWDDLFSSLEIQFYDIYDQLRAHTRTYIYAKFCCRKLH